MGPGTTARRGPRPAGPAGSAGGDLVPGGEVELLLTGMAGEGDAVGRLGGLAVFAAGGVPGERVRVRVREVRPRHARGEVVAVLEPGPGRVVPPCPVAGACGGCRWQHLTYPKQLEWKRRLVQDALERVGRLVGVPVPPTLGMEDPWGYRNKGAIPFRRVGGRVVAGFFRPETHEVVDLPPVEGDAAGGCRIQHPLVNRVAAAVRGLVGERGIPAYDETDGTGLLRHLVVRVGVRTGEALAVLVVNGEDLPGAPGLARDLTERVPELVGVVMNVNTAPTNVILGPVTRVLAGRDHLFEEVGGLRFKVSARSFFQVNTLQAERLYALALDAAGLTGGEFLADAYCGTGAMALLAARRCRRVVGVEELREAVEDARENARLNGIGNVRFRVGRVEERLEDLREGSRGPDALLLDPPRKGCDARVLRACLEMRPRRLVYVSCNPATLARDLAVLAAGYRIAAVRPVDLFPQTPHVECVAELLLP